jgi:hypothetical protein
METDGETRTDVIALRERVNVALGSAKGSDPFAVAAVEVSVVDDVTLRGRAYVYLMKMYGVTKVGVTSDIDRRMAEHRRNGWKQVKVWEVQNMAERVASRRTTMPRDGERVGSDGVRHRSSGTHATSRIHRGDANGYRAFGAHHQRCDEVVHEPRPLRNWSPVPLILEALLPVSGLRDKRGRVHRETDSS